MTIISTLSAEFILGLIAERDEKRELVDRLSAEIAALEKRIDAAMLFAPAGFNPAAPMPDVEGPPRPQTRSSPLFVRWSGGDDKTTWREAILGVLATAGRGMSHKNVVAMARDRYVLPPVRDGEEKAFYNALSKLVHSGQVVKHGNLLYLASTYREADKAGALPAVGPTARRVGSSAELVAGLLREHAEGLTGPQLRDHLRRVPDAPKSLWEHAQYVYNILAPMIGSGEVVKSQDGVYRHSSHLSEQEKT